MKKRILAILMAAIMCCLQLAEFVPAEKVKAAYSVSEEDIYYRCPEYLDNKAYDNYMARCEERIEKGMSTINDAEGLGASILYSLQNGADIIISELASKAGIGQSTKDKLNKEVVYQLIQAYLSSDTSATNTVSQIGNAYSTISDAYNVANATDLYNYKVSLKNSSLNLSDNQVDKLVDMYTDADTFSKILGYAGNAQKALKIITAYIEMQDLDLAVLNKLDDAFSSMDSEFASAIRSIMSDRTSDFLTFAKKNYLQDEVIKKMVSAVAKYGSSPVVFVKNVCANILGKIYKSFCPTADQIIQAGMCQAYTYLARNKVNKLRKEFKNGKTSAEKIEQYKVVYGFYIITMKTTMDKVAGCVNGSDKSVKQALKSWAGSLSGFSYATYMDRCCSEASADVSAGLLKISGNTVTRKTPSGATIDGNYDSTESIKARLAAIKQKYPPNQGATWKGDWGGATQCFGFARMVFFFLYGKEMPARYYSNARYQYRDENGVNKVGQLTGNFTAAPGQQLFAQAKIGDVIQASTTASSGQHTMIFTGLTSKGITVYDCNAAVNGCAPGGCGINEWERSYSELAKGTYGYGSSNGGITIYRADNYASIYGDGDDVFYDDSANFIIKDGVLVKYTGWQPFVEIPDTVTAIGDEAFLNNKTMIHVLIPDSVKSIGNSAFEGCTSLTEITLPDTVTTIQDHAFKNCTALKTINWSKSITDIQSYAFENCDALTKLDIPNTVTNIGTGAFYECGGFTDIAVPNSVKSLGSRAFENCDALAKVSISHSVTSMGEKAFYDCDALTDVKLGTGITQIPTSCFEHCDALPSVVLPYRVSKVGDNAFKNCVALTEITIPRATTSISTSAFSYPAKMTVYGISGTYAETFANQQGMKFVNKAVKATNVVLDKTELTLNRGMKYSLTMTVTPATFTDKVSWKSTNVDVAAIAEDGTVTAKGAGQATIKVTVGEVSATCKVNVVQPVTSIYLNKTALEMTALDTYQLQASVYPSEANNKEVSWESSDEKVATVDKNGLVQAKEKGTAVITAKAKDGSEVSRSCKVTVKNTAYVVTDISKLESTHNYENNCSDFWVYTKTGASALNITFNSKTALEEDFDYLYVFDKENKQVGKYTGTQLAGKTITVSGDTVKIQLVSDDAGNAWGFKVDVITEKVEEECKHTDTTKREVRNAKAATCTLDGYSGDIYCTNCGNLIEAGSVTKAIGHQWDNGVITKAATATQTGIKTYTCTVCKITRTEVIKALGNNTKPIGNSNKPKLKTGEKITDKSTGAVYKVTGKNTVEYVKATSKKASRTIPSTVKLKGIKCQVTSIATKAFKGDPKIKAVVIPATVRKIGKEAFAKCKNLKKITIKTTYLSSKKVGANAFKGIHAKATIKVPKKQKKAYQKLLKARGVGKKVTVK